MKESGWSCGSQEARQSRICRAFPTSFHRFLTAHRQITITQTHTQRFSHLTFRRTPTLSVFLSLRRRWPTFQKRKMRFFDLPVKINTKDFKWQMHMKNIKKKMDFLIFNLYSARKLFSPLMSSLFVKSPAAVVMYKSWGIYCSPLRIPECDKIPLPPRQHC